MRLRSGARVRVGGLVITRQAPGTAKRIRFFTLEDELGHVNLTIYPDVYQRYRREAAAPILVVDGIVQRQDGVWSVLAQRIEPLEGATKEHSRSHDYK
jgi:DNA polymerase III alpha subunit